MGSIYLVSSTPSSPHGSSLREAIKNGQSWDIVGGGCGWSGDWDTVPTLAVVYGFPKEYQKVILKQITYYATLTVVVCGTE